MEIFFTTMIEERPAIGLLLAFCLLAVLSCVPFLPTPLVVGLLATQFDWYVAFTVSLAGNIVGSLVMFLFMRKLLRQYAAKQLAKYTYGKQFELFMQQHGFLAVLIGRIIPIMPSAALNTIASVTGISFTAFCVATCIGKMPNLLVYSLAGSELQNSPMLTTAFVLLYVIVLGAVAKAIKTRIGGTVHAD